MILTSDTGEARTFRIPMRLDGVAFSPGELYTLIFTLKADENDDDEDAKVQKRTGGYGITVNGSTALVAFVYVDTAGGTVGEEEVPALAAGDYVWDIRAQLVASPYTSRIVRKGVFTLNQAITQGLETEIDIYTTNPPAGVGGDVAGDTHAATSKATPVDADEIPLADSATSWVLKKLTWANLKATLKTYFDTLYDLSGSALTALNTAVQRDNHTGTQAHTTITGLGTLATQNGTFSGTSSGNNTGDQDISGKANVASPTFTGSVTSPAYVATGQSLTGSQATNLLDLSTAWNTTGDPNLIYGRVTNTASGLLSTLIDLGTVAEGSLFKVNRSGGVVALGYTGSGAGLTGTAFGLSIGGNAATATSAASVTNLTIGGATTISTGGTIALGGYTLTVSATGTAALLGTANTFTAATTNSTAGASGVPVHKLSGAWLTSSAQTSPQFLINDPTNTTFSGSASGTGLAVNAKTAFTGNLADFQVNGSSKATISSDGSYTAAGGVLSAYNTAGTNALRIGGGVTFEARATAVVTTTVFGFHATSSTSTPTSGLSQKNSTSNWIKAGNGTANDATATFEAGDLISSAVGKGLQIKGGSALARAGNATLVGGTVTVSNTTITANSIIYLTRKTAGGSIGDLTYTLSASTSFTINSASGTDTSTVSFIIVELN